MGRSFWMVMALIGILVILIVFFQFQAASHKAPASLAGSNWTLVQYSSGNITLIQVTRQPAPTLLFMTDNSGSIVGGSAGCNRFTGEYAQNGSHLAFSALGSTKMFCDLPGVMELETAFLSGLEKTASYRSNSGYLVLNDNSGKTLLVFKQE